MESFLPTGDDYKNSSILNNDNSEELIRLDVLNLLRQSPKQDTPDFRKLQALLPFMVINSRSNGGFTLLEEACHHSSLDVVRYIIDQPADMTAKKNHNLLYWTFLNTRNPEVLQYFIDPQNHLIIEQFEDNTTELHIAACRQNLAKVKEILEKNPFRVNEKNLAGWTPLHYAILAANDNLQDNLLIQYLLSKILSVRERDNILRSVIEEIKKLVNKNSSAGDAFINQSIMFYEKIRTLISRISELRYEDNQDLAIINYNLGISYFKIENTKEKARDFITEAIQCLEKDIEKNLSKMLDIRKKDELYIQLGLYYSKRSIVSQYSGTKTSKEEIFFDKMKVFSYYKKISKKDSASSFGLHHVIQDVLDYLNDENNADLKNKHGDLVTELNGLKEQYSNQHKSTRYGTFSMPSPSPSSSIPLETEMHDVVMNKKAGYQKIRELIEKKGADVKQAGLFLGNSILENAVINGSLETVKFLLEKGIDCKTRSERNLLQCALQNPDILKFIADPDQRIVEQFEDDTTYFHAAAISGDLPRIGTLFDQDPSLLTQKNKQGDTALDYAIFGKNKQMVEFILNKLDSVENRNEILKHVVEITLPLEAESPKNRDRKNLIEMHEIALLVYKRQKDMDISMLLENLYVLNTAYLKLLSKMTNDEEIKICFDKLLSNAEEIISYKNKMPKTDQTWRILSQAFYSYAFLKLNFSTTKADHGKGIANYEDAIHCLKKIEEKSEDESNLLINYLSDYATRLEEGLLFASSDKIFEYILKKINDALEEAVGLTQGRKDDISQGVQLQYKRFLTQRNFIKKKREIGFSLFDVEKDGDCFFRVIEELIKDQKVAIPGYQRGELTHSKLRKIMIQHLKDHRAYYKSFCVENFDSYVCKMNQEGAWIDQIGLGALARALNLTLVIFDRENKIKFIIKPENSLYEFYLFHETLEVQGNDVELHYQGLIPIPGKEHLYEHIRKRIKEELVDTLLSEPIENFLSNLTIQDFNPKKQEGDKPVLPSQVSGTLFSSSQEEKEWLTHSDSVEDRLHSP